MAGAELPDQSTWITPEDGLIRIGQIASQPLLEIFSQPVQVSLKWVNHVSFRLFRHNVIRTLWHLPF